MKQKLLGTISMFKGHNRSIRAIIASEILFGTALAWFGLYRPVYMVSLGLSKVQVGIVSSVLLATQVFAAMLGGFAASRIGNKRSMQLFDTVGWLTSTLLWLTARSFSSFVVAALFNGLYYGAIPNWMAIVAGNSTPERRPTVYGLIHLAFLGSGLFAPIAGAFVSRFGIIAGSRLIFAAGFVIVLAALIVRQMFVEEVELPERPSPLDDNRDQYGFRGAVRLIAKDIRVLALLAAFTLGGFSFVIWSNYSALYMTEAAGLAIPAALISALPVVNSLSMAIVLLLVVPNINVKNHNRALAIGSSLMPCAIVIFLLAPKQLFWPVLLFSFVNAGANALYDPLRSTLQANLIPPRLFASVISLGSTISLLSSVPIGPLAGKLFVQNPRFPFFVILTFQVCVATIMWYLSMQDAKPSQA